VIEDQTSTWFHVFINCTHGFFRIVCVLDHTQAQDDIELIPLERQTEDVSLRDSVILV